MSSLPVNFHFEALILDAGSVFSASLRSPSSSLSSFFALPLRARGVRSRSDGEGDWGQSLLKCPLCWQLKHLPSFIRRMRSSVVILRARVRPGVVSMVFGSFSTRLLLNPCRHLFKSFFFNKDWSFLVSLTPNICRHFRYTSWCLRADSFHLSHKSGLSISTQFLARGFGKPLMNFSRTVGSSTPYPARATYCSNLVMYLSICPPSIRSFVSS